MRFRDDLENFPARVGRGREGAFLVFEIDPGRDLFGQKFRHGDFGVRQMPAFGVPDPVCFPLGFINASFDEFFLRQGPKRHILFQVFQVENILHLNAIFNIRYHNDEKLRRVRGFEIGARHAGRDLLADFLVGAGVAQPVSGSLEVVFVGVDIVSDLETALAVNAFQIFDAGCSFAVSDFRAPSGVEDFMRSSSNGT